METWQAKPGSLEVVGMSRPLSFTQCHGCFDFSVHEESAVCTLPRRNEKLGLSFVIYRADVKWFWWFYHISDNLGVGGRKGFPPGNGGVCCAGFIPILSSWQKRRPDSGPRGLGLHRVDDEQVRMVPSAAVQAPAVRGLGRRGEEGL